MKKSLLALILFAALPAFAKPLPPATCKAQPVPNWKKFCSANGQTLPTLTGKARIVKIKDTVAPNFGEVWYTCQGEKWRIIKVSCSK